MGGRANEPVAHFPDRRSEREIARLRRFLARIASTTEIAGMGAVEEMTTGPAARELQARMRMAQRGLDGDEYP